jgi:hypothetical protein
VLYIIDLLASLHTYAIYIPVTSTRCSINTQMGPPPFREAFVTIMMKNPELQSRPVSRNLDNLHLHERA